jgi:hypothetical protein
MGSSSSGCKNLNSLHNGCEISECVRDVSGLHSNSLSPSNQWNLTLIPGTKYEFVNIPSVFMKFFINYTYFTGPESSNLKSALNSLNIDSINIDDFANKIKSLEYELIFYKDIIRPIIDSNICTNFVRYIGSGIGCTYNNIEAIGLKGVNITPEMIFINNLFPMCELTKSLTKKALCSSSNRPPLSSTNSPLMNMRSPFMKTFANVIGEPSVKDSLRYDMLLTENLGSSQSMHEWYFSPRENRAYIINKTFEDIKNETTTLENAINNIQVFGDFHKLIFQLSFAIASLSLSGSNQSDMHLANIFVEDMETPQPMSYWLRTKINDRYRRYYMMSRYKVKLYDYDRGYSPSLGPNVMNSLKSVSINTYDILYCLSRFYVSKNYPHTKEWLNNLLSKTTEGMNFLDTTNPRFLFPNGLKPNKRFFEQNYFSVLKYIILLGKFFADVHPYLSFAFRDNISILDENYYIVPIEKSTYFSIDYKLATVTNKNIIDLIYTSNNISKDMCDQKYTPLLAEKDRNIEEFRINNDKLVEKLEKKENKIKKLKAIINTLQTTP